MNGLFANLRSLGPVRLGTIGAVLASTIGFFVFLSSHLVAPSYGLLYGDLDLRDSGAIVQKLDALNIPYQLKAGGAVIMVPTEQVDKLRLTMADTGLPHGGSVGYEIFDKGESLGTSSLVQNLNILRALEGELARTIGSLSAVQTARVHLVLPQRELFSRDRQQPSASIVLKLRGPERLAKPQVAAIQHLVAAAVPGLTPGRVSIVDTEGTLLARGTGDGDNGSDLSAEDRQTAFENHLARNVEEMIERSVGPGKVRAEVHADMDFDRVTTNSESYDPDGQVVRSTQTVNDQSMDADNSNQQVSVANNLPNPPAANPAAPAAKSTNGHNAETTNYEISKTIKNEVTEGGVVKRLSVAVLIDGTTATAHDGTRKYTPRSPDEMKQLTTLVRTAIGYNQQRGDTVEVLNLPFATPDEPLAAAPDGILGFSRADLLRVAEPIALSLVGLLVLLLVVRPLVGRLLDGNPGGAPALAGPDGTQQLLTGPASAGALAGPAAMQAGLPAMVTPNSSLESIEQMIDINQVEGRVRASSIKKIGEIVDKHPEEAVAIVRAWMYQNA